MARVYVSARGNVFMREIAEHLVEALDALGRPAELVTTALPGPDGDPLDQLVVAPHELFPLFDTSPDVRLASAHHCVCVNTEQEGTPFFETAMTFAACGPVVLDINPFSLDAVRRRGLAAVHLPLGYTPSMDRWRREARERLVDIAFMGGRTERRELFLAGAASQLWEWRTDLRLFSWHRPITGAGSGFLVGPAKFAALTHSRLLLNVHRSDEPYFEWARVIEAVANGCVVATESSVGIEPFVAGEHLVEAPLEHLAERTVALAFDEPRRAAMADAAYELLTSELQQSTLLDRALVAARTAPASRARSSRRRVDAGDAARRVVAAGRRALLPGSSMRAAETEGLRSTAAELKRAYLAQAAHTRAIAATLTELRLGDPDHAVVTHSPAWADASPRVSVVIPLYDQGHFLGDAVRSVVGAGSGTCVELIVVDDASTDDSAGVAQRLLDEHPWLPMTLIERAANGGLPVARNTGFAAARAPYVFALDADNVLYPAALRVLADRLDASPPDVIAAYGILERFDEHGSVGLASHLPWDVDLLVRGAFIDAMAMLRRNAWEALGGYAHDHGIYGWEDYDLWLSAAERGWRAELVTRFVGRYREQSGSMRRLSDIDMAGNFVTLRERHPRLPWPS